MKHIVEKYTKDLDNSVYFMLEILKWEEFLWVIGIYFIVGIIGFNI